MQCERCGNLAMKGWKYCKSCKTVVRGELHRNGYLEQGFLGRQGMGRMCETTGRSALSSFSQAGAAEGTGLA